MVEPAELRPEELDRLEDALELLEFADTEDPSPMVRERLGDFRTILQLSRSVLPMVDVPHGILDRVMAEAREAAEVPVLAPVAAAPAAEPVGFWAKLRRFAVVPGVALAGAAALVLIMFERSPESSVSGTEMRDEIAKADAPKHTGLDESTRALDAVPARAPGGPPPPPPSTGAIAPAAEPAATAPAIISTPKPEPAAAEDMPAEEEPSAEKLDRAETADVPDRKRADGNADTILADDDGTPRWDIIARGDRARHKGDCDGALTEYKLALGDADARVRARAHAGIGLCSAAEGSSSAADSAYKAARELDPEISGFIETEKPRGTGGGIGSANAARSKAKKAQKAAPPPAQQQQAPNVDASDPVE